MENQSDIPAKLLLLMVAGFAYASEDSSKYWTMPTAIRDLLPVSGSKINYRGVDFSISLAKVYGKYTNVSKAEQNVAQLKNDGIADAVFFRYVDMRAGTRMNLHFLRTSRAAKFISHKLAESFDFGSTELPGIFQQFSIEPHSKEAGAMMQAVALCELPAQPNEEKACVTSLESMLSFITSKLGDDAIGLSTELVDKMQQNYTIAHGLKELSSDTVACHSLPYIYPVFYCHKIHDTKAFKVPLVSDDGTKGSAVGICHMDTSKWSPGHLAFYQLKLKPGDGPICHFLTQSDVAWISA